MSPQMRFESAHPGSARSTSPNFTLSDEEAGLGRLIRRLGRFLLWILSGFGLLHIFARRRGSRHRQPEVVVYAVHRAFYLWPLIVFGFAGAWIVGRWPESALAAAFGWVYIGVLVFTLASLLFDVHTTRFLLWAGIFLFAWVVSKYFEDLKHVVVLSGVFAYLHNLQPRLDPGFATVMSWLLLGPWIGSLFHSFTNGRKRFTPNEIAEWYMGDGSELTDRSGLKFRTRYRDVLEMILGFGAGDLVGLDGAGHQVKRYENVLFLFFLWGRLDEVLHQRAAVVDNAPNDPLDVATATRAQGE